MPGAGPILLFDKSALQGLSVNESVWLDTFYYPSITPLFFVETLADLDKEVNKGRSPEEVVGNLAEKTPMGGRINVHHRTLWVNELLGNELELRHCPIVSGGQAVTTSDGRHAVKFDPPPEEEALTRWRQGSFLDVEHLFARAWRESLSGVDLEAIFQEGRDIIRRVGRPSDLSAAKIVAAEMLGKPGSRYVRNALEAFHPKGLACELLGRWKASGCPPIQQFAPYYAHALLVDLFFCISLGADLIGRERPSNIIDLAYLYYLPCCMVFTSSDKLHERVAPLFLEDGQVFIRGQDLKADLAKLDAHYSQLSDEEKARGVMSFAHYPPVEGEFLVSELWDKLMRPEWRQWASLPPEKRSKESETQILAEVRELTAATPTGVNGTASPDHPDAVLILRNVPLYRGKWRMLPPEVEKSSE